MLYTPVTGMMTIFRLLFVSCTLAASLAEINTLHGKATVRLTALLNVRREGNECGDVTPTGMASVAGFLYAIDVVSKNPSILPLNTTLGYEIYDMCSSAERANELAFSFAQRNDLLRVPSDKRNATPPVSVVIASIGSDAALFVASLLQVKSIPIISTDATSEGLNHERFKTFFRTIPSDANQARAVADLIEYFNWTYVGIVAGAGSYGQFGAMALEDEAHVRETFCIAFFETVSRERKNKLKRVVQSIKNSGKVRVIVLWTTRTTAAEFLTEVNRQDVSGRTWIAPDGWSQGWWSFSQNVGVFRGFIGVNFRSYSVPGFREYLSESVGSAWAGSELWREYLYRLGRNCSGDSPCANGSLNLNLTDELYEQMNYPYLAFMIDAVHAAAQAIGTLCRHDNNQCADIYGAELLPRLKQVSFTGVTGEVRLDSKDRGSAARYNILNLQQEPSGNLVLNTVGTWDGARRERLVIRDDLIVWPNESRAVPISACSARCPPGTMQTRAVSCCWECLPCTGRTVSEEPGSANCTPCARDERPNDQHDACAKLPDVSIKWNDEVVLAIVGCAALGVSLVVFVLITYVKFRATPVIKSSNPYISYCLMVGITLAFASVVISLLTPGTVTCYSANALYSTCMVTCISVLFLKTNRLVHIFELNLLSSAFTRWCCKGRNQFLLLGLLHLIPLSLLVLWIVLEPPAAVVFIEPMRSQHLECRIASGGVAQKLLLMVFAYVLVISIVCTCYAFKARKLPGNFNEAKFITFAMCIQLMCVVSTLTVYGSLGGSNLVEFDCSIKLLSAFGFLLCIFGPKIYVIYRHPEKNTTDYVKSLVASHTLRNASGINVGPSQSRRSTVSTVIGVNPQTTQTTL